MGSCSNTDIDPTYQYQYNNTQNITFLPVDTNLSSSDKKISLMEKNTGVLWPRIMYPGKTWLKGEELISSQNFSSTYQA